MLNMYLSRAVSRLPVAGRNFPTAVLLEFLHSKGVAVHQIHRSKRFVKVSVHLHVPFPEALMRPDVSAAALPQLQQRDTDGFDVHTPLHLRYFEREVLSASRLLPVPVDFVVLRLLSATSADGGRVF